MNNNRRRKNIYSKKKKRRSRIIGNYIKIGVACVAIAVLLVQGVKIINGGTNMKVLGNTQYELLLQPPTPQSTDIVPGFNITYAGLENAVDVHDVDKMMKGQYEGEEKYAFLTFDDGPSPLTNKILDILEEKDANGTFFILGNRLNDGQATKDTLKRIVEEGNAIANHSYTHDYKKLYPGNSINVDYFMEEFDKANDAIREVLGENFDTRVLRMPGGYNSRQYYRDPSLPSFNERLKNEDVVSVDWNALNGDAEGRSYNPSEMVEYLKNTVGNKKYAIILMHDTYGKEKTVETLPEIIDYLKNEGYQFKTMK